MLSKEAMLRGLALLPHEAMLTVKEAEFLYDTARSFDKPISWCEVGCWAGRSLWAAACGAPEKSFVGGVDNCKAILPVFEGSSDTAVHGDEQWQADLLNATTNAIIRLTGCKSSWTRGDSVEIGKAGQEHLKGMFIDVLVLDADHSYEAVKADLDAWLPLLKEGSVLLVHDFTVKYEGTRKAVQERFLSERIMLCPGTRYAKVLL